MPNFVSTVNFSSTNSGLATVGYKMFNLDGTEFQARTTSNVVELGTSTGIYRTIVTYPPFFQGFVLWDTGTGTPVYASESINPQDADPVLDGVRTQLRSMNTSLSAYLQKQFKLEDMKPLQESIEELSMQLQSLSEVEDDDKDEEILTAIKNINIQPIVNTPASLPIDLKPLEIELSKKLNAIQKDVSQVILDEKNMVSELRSGLGDVLTKLDGIEVKPEVKLHVENKEILSSLEELKVSDKTETTMTKMIGDAAINIQKILSSKTSEQISAFKASIEQQKQQLKLMNERLAEDLNQAEARIKRLIDSKTAEILSMDERHFLNQEAERVKAQRLHLIAGLSNG